MINPRNILIRFDWAMKRLLRQKSNFVILEGFLSVLLKDDIKIQQLLESESNQDTPEDKYNRVDLLALNAADELIIIEVQNNRQLDYFQRILFGVSKATTEHISLGESYKQIKKVYSVNLVYFELGQGKDYVYHGKTEFLGIHDGQKLNLSKKQRELFDKQDVYQIFPEYYVIKINNFNNVAHDNLDEWIYYFKNNEVLKGAKAKGLKEVEEYLRVQKLSDKERQQYIRDMENLSSSISMFETARIEGRAELEDDVQELEEKNKELQKQLENTEKNIAFETARKMKAKGFDFETIAEMTGLSILEIENL